MNRPDPEGPSTAPPKKKTKIDDPAKHTYPAIPDGADEKLGATQGRKPKTKAHVQM